MTGMGECWKHILKNSDKDSHLIGIDFSTEMINRAEKNKARFTASKIEVLNENIFENSIENEVADYIVSGFGLKTFSDEQLGELANEIYRILKPNGEFTLIDISVPKNKLLNYFICFI